MQQGGGCGASSSSILFVLFKAARWRWTGENQVACRWKLQQRDLR